MPNPTEAQTRKQLIDPALKRAGWDLTNPDLIREEIPVDDFGPDAWRALEARLRMLRAQHQIPDVDLPAGITDYALYRPDADIIAVVEAKRTTTDPRLAHSSRPVFHNRLSYLKALPVHQSPVYQFPNSPSLWYNTPRPEN